MELGEECMILRCPLLRDHLCVTSIEDDLRWSLRSHLCITLILLRGSKRCKICCWCWGLRIDDDGGGDDDHDDGVIVDHGVRLMNLQIHDVYVASKVEKSFLRAGHAAWYSATSDLKTDHNWKVSNRITKWFGKDLERYYGKSEVSFYKSIIQNCMYNYKSSKTIQIIQIMFFNVF